jgi:probable phosphoglycerate mutase
VEGRTTAELREEVPGWDIWRDGPRGGETVEEVGARADRVIARVAGAGGDVAIFAHGHVLRVLGARWIGLEAKAGALLALDTATISELGFERERRVIRSWNR